jgi:hypothetical protein
MRLITGSLLLSIEISINFSKPSERRFVFAVQTVMEVDQGVVALHILIQRMEQVPEIQRPRLDYNIRNPERMTNGKIFFTGLCFIDHSTRD